MATTPPPVHERDTPAPRGLSALTDHLGLKVLALALAVLLWFVLHLHVLPPR